jgi:hypothetical protein
MTLGEKILQNIHERGYRTLNEFHAELVSVFEDKAITRRTLTRLVNNRVLVREHTLNQVAVILGIKTSTLREGTDAEVKDAEQMTGIFTYNEKAVLHSFRKSLPFVPEKLVLRSGGRTSEEQDRPDARESLKWFFVIMGRVNLVTKGPLGEEKRSFHKGEEFVFDARQLHCFESAFKRPSVIIIIHYPAQNSDFYSPAS